MAVNMSKTSLCIIVRQTSNASGAGILVAKGHGRQKTTRLDHSKGTDANFGAAAGALVNLLTDDRQQAMLRHPSARSRVKEHHLSDFGGGRRYIINV
jgi:hypothetical protein